MGYSLNERTVKSNTFEKKGKKNDEKDFKTVLLSFCDTFRGTLAGRRFVVEVSNVRRIRMDP